MLRAWLILAFAAVAWGQTVPGAAAGTEERLLGPIAVGDRSYTVALAVAKLAGEETVSNVQVKDVDGAVCFERRLAVQAEAGRFLETTSVQAEIVRGTGGSGLLLTFAVLPSTPLGGHSWQVLGVAGGKLVPFGPPVTLEGELLGHAPGAAMNASRDEALRVDVLTFRVWTGNLFVILPLEVNWEAGYMRPAYRLVARPRMLVEAQRKPAEGDGSVQLFQEPDEKSGAPSRVGVRRDSVVEFLLAEASIQWDETEDVVHLGVSEDIWLKVRIDGREGYIHTPEDLEAIGLPEAG